MIEKAANLKKDLPAVHGHTFYSFKETDKYTENAVAYIVSGIEQGDYILFIENHKLFSVIQKKLKMLLSIDQLAKIRYMNNFDFYFSKGTFHPTVIFEHFTKAMEPYIENNLSVRTWGHVEWRDQKDVHREIEIYEKKADEVFSLNEITAVCAYDTDRMTNSLKLSLMKCHQYFMTDDEILKIVHS